LEKYGVDIIDMLSVWHGSPHNFDRFSTDKIGIGEGNQAFGWGLYFTDLKGIAEGYAEKLSEQGTANYTLDGKALPEVLAPYLYDSRTKKKDLITDIDNAIKSNKSLLPNSKGFPQYDRLKAENEGLLKAKSFLLGSKSEIQFEPSRNLYKVELHEGKTPEQYNWLEWDKIISEKNAINIIKGLRKKGFTAKDTGLLYDAGYGDKEEINNIKSKIVYETISDLLGGDKNASLFLLENGIDGIKYPAESIARGATSDNARGFNYVVFDENAIKIEEKIQFLKTKDGTIYGFKTPDGKVFINTDNLNANTPIHEFGHIWQSVFPQGFARGIELLKLSPQGRALIRRNTKESCVQRKVTR
jgi:hypothetical protein